MLALLLTVAYIALVFASALMTLQIAFALIAQLPSLAEIAEQ